MLKRIILLFIGSILLTAVAGPGVQAGDDDDDDDQVTVDWQFAGAFFNGFAQPFGNPDPAFLFHVEAKGEPGSATILGVNQGPGTGTTPAGNTAGCFEGANLKLIPIPGAEPNENSLAATFKDLSVLNMARDEDALEEGFLCLSFDEDGNTTRFDAVVPIRFTGGFGDFEGATGEGLITLQSMPVITGSNFGSEIGTITGTVFLPED